MKAGPADHRANLLPQPCRTGFLTDIKLQQNQRSGGVDRAPGTHMIRPASCWSSAGVRPNGIVPVGHRRPAHDVPGPEGREYVAIIPGSDGWIGSMVSHKLIRAIHGGERPRTMTADLKKITRTPPERFSYLGLPAPSVGPQFGPQSCT